MTRLASRVFFIDFSLPKNPKIFKILRHSKTIFYIKKNIPYNREYAIMIDGFIRHHIHHCRLINCPLKSDFYDSKKKIFSKKNKSKNLILAKYTKIYIRELLQSQINTNRLSTIDITLNLFFAEILARKFRNF